MGVTSELGVEPLIDPTGVEAPKPYYAQVKGEAGADVAGAIEGLMRAYQGDPELRVRVKDYLWHESKQVEEQVLLSKRHLPLEMAAREDEFSRGELSGLERAMTCITNLDHMDSTLKELEGK